MRTLITMCARGGSKGIPGKNIKPLNGQPLIFYTIRVAKEFQEAVRYADIILSTDSEEIIKTAEECGLRSSYRRPDRLADDTAGKIDVIRDVLLWKEDIDSCRYNFILDLDVTSPLRNLHDLKLAFEIIQNNEVAVNLFSVSPSGRNPYFNMVEQKENGFYAQVSKPDGLILTRQSAPKVYDINASFYFYKRVFFDLGYKGAITDKSLIYVIPHTCFDLDHPIDFEIISYLIAEKKLDFEL